MHRDGVDDDLGGGSCAPSPARFELQEDPSFSKDNNVQVVIRIRPLNGSEVSLQGHKRCVRQGSSHRLTWIGHHESRFTFDLVADEYVTQEEMFKVAGVPMVENCLAGYNSCMFAYGQTGSGKTHTMLGDIENGTRRNNVNCGITPRVFEHLFARIQKEKELRRDEKLRFICKCSFLEIYNEQILDLLNPNSVNLQIREDARKGIHVENLMEHEISSAREALHQLFEGAANRKVAVTNMNRASSRSHSVFTCLIESKWESQGINHHRFSRLNLVDLAGSETQKSSGAEGERLKEATNINKSLSTLGLVITNLIAVSNKKAQHVPYRDSKLTFLLQDSLGGNSKTTIIANISPSSCCAAETLSSLKFAQRAKYIRNNAIVNEDASGDVLSMRVQIQNLKKEISRLKGQLGSDKTEGIASHGFVCESPSTFKWDQGHGMFTPLNFDKRATQRNDYDAALVAAFRREQEKEAQLKAMIDAKQFAEQLAAQKTEELRSFKMRLRFRENGIKRLEQVASGKLSAEAHLLQEKENLVKELEDLRGQLDRNPEITKFAMENLQLKEESFVDEGEREMMHEQIIVLQDKLLEALDWKLMHDKGHVNKGLSLFGQSAGNEENEFLRLQAIQNEREIESLRKKLTFCLEAKENLERHVNELTTELELTKNHDNTDKEFEAAQLQEQGDEDLHDLSDAQMELKTLVDAISSASQREAEAHETAIGLAKENEELRRLVELYEHAVVDVEANQDGNLVNEDLLNAQPTATSDLHAHNSANVAEVSKIVDEKCTSEDNSSKITSVELRLQLEEMHEENDRLMGLYEKAMRERDEFQRKILEQRDSEAVKEIQLGEKDVEMSEASENPEVKHVDDSTIVALKEVLQIVRSKLELIQDKVVSAQDAVKYFKLFEMASSKAVELSARIELQRLGAQHGQEDITALKSLLSEAQEKRNAVEGKYFLPAASCWNLGLKIKSLAESKFDVSFESMNQKKEQLNHLQTRKIELSAARTRVHESKTELRSKIDGLKVKLRSYEAQRKKEEKVLFAIDNLDTSTTPMHKTKNYGKATELLKWEEDRMKLWCELQKAREQLSMVQKEIRSMNKCDNIDCEIAVLEAEIEDSCLSVLEADIENFVCDNTLTEFWEGRAKGMEALLVEYQDCVFQVNLKEEEIKVCNESLLYQARDLDELLSKLNQAIRELSEILQGRRRLTACRLDEDLHNLSDAQIELKTLVDEIASASQREAEAHQTAISLAKENEELRMQLKVLIEDNKRLVELYEHAVVDVEANQDGNPVNEDLLNSQPKATSDLHAHNSANVAEESKIVDEKCTNEDNSSKITWVELRLQLEEMHEENDILMGLYEKAMQERDEFKRKILEQSDSEAVKEILGEKDVEMSEASENPEVKHVHDSTIVALKEVLQIVRSKLELVQDKVVSAQDAVKYSKLLEMASSKAEELSARVEIQRLGAQHAQEDIIALKSLPSEAQEKKNAVEGKYFLPAASCWNVAPKIKCLAESKFDVSFASMNQKEEQLNHLQTRKIELSAARTRVRKSEAQLTIKIYGLKVKLYSYEAQRKEEVKVLCAIDNLDTSTTPMQKTKNYLKATELLKSEEDGIKLGRELQKACQELSMVQKEIKRMNKCDNIHCEIAVLEAEIEDAWLSMLETDIEKFVRDNTLTEFWEGRAKDMEALLVEYRDCVFQVNLKEVEIKESNESLQYQARDLDELQSKLNQAMRELGELLQDGRSETTPQMPHTLEYAYSLPMTPTPASPIPVANGDDVCSDSFDPWFLNTQSASMLDDVEMEETILHVPFDPWFLDTQSASMLDVDDVKMEETILQ